MSFIKFSLNGSAFSMPLNKNEYKTIMQFCESVNVIIPRFCYHERLSIAGNCRMCLVEVSSSIKPVISCATRLNSDIQIFTNTSFVHKMREAVLEFLLINHPLDCPICDQGGECDLQDQTLLYGSDKGRYFFEKRSVLDKFFDSVLKTIMTRCIHCTRCIRYIDEYLFDYKIGIMGRGSNMEISNYITTPLNSSYIDFTGNLIDLCPVGAITSKNNAYKQRPWELNSFESIDVFDSINSNIRVDVKGNTIMRIMPKLNEVLNEDFISNKVRFSILKFSNIKLKNPFYFFNSNISCSWSKSYNIIYLVFFLFKNERFHFVNNIVSFFIGPKIDFFSSSTIKYVSSFFNCNYILNNNSLNIDLRNNFLLSKNLISFFKNNYYLYFNIDVSKDSPFINLKMKKKNFIFHNINNKVDYIGRNMMSNTNLNHISINLKSILKFIKGKQYKFNNRMVEFIEGSSYSFFNRYESMYSYLKKRKVSYNTIKKNSSYIHFSELGLNNCFFNTSIYINKFSIFDFILYNISDDLSDSLDSTKFKITHSNSTSTYSNLFLPSAGIYESNDLYFNLEGKAQYSNKIVNNLNNAFTISFFLSEVFNFFIFKTQYFILNSVVSLNNTSMLLKKILVFSFEPMFFSSFSISDKKITNISYKFSKLCSKQNNTSYYSINNITSFYYKNEKNSHINNFKLNLNNYSYVL